MFILAINFKVKHPLSTVPYYSEEMPTPRLAAWLYFMTKKTICIWLYILQHPETFHQRLAHFSSIFSLLSLSEGKPEEIIHFRVFFQHWCLMKFRSKNKVEHYVTSFEYTNSVFVWVKFHDTPFQGTVKLFFSYNSGASNSVEPQQAQGWVQIIFFFKLFSDHTIYCKVIGKLVLL